MNHTFQMYTYLFFQLVEHIATLSELYQLQNGGVNSLEFCGGIAGGCARSVAVITRAQGSLGHLRGK